MKSFARLQFAVARGLNQDKVALMKTKPQHIENITKAAQTVSLLCGDLRDAQTAACGAKAPELDNPLIHLVVCDLLAEARKLDARIGLLLHAIESEGKL